MELRQLKIFSTAAQELNFTKAAKKLDYTQANITNQIRQLEEELNVKLFDRLGRGVILSAEGKLFLNYAQDILAQCEKAKNIVSSYNCRRVINIGSSETSCLYRLPQLLLKYRNLFPQAEIKIQTISCAQILDLLKNNRIDLGLVITRKIELPHITATELAREPLVFIVSPDHPLAQAGSLQPDRLSGECMLTTSADCGYRPAVLSMLKQCDIRPGSVMELSSVTAIKECALCGLGFAVLPKVAVENELAQGTLVELTVSRPPAAVHTQLIYHQDKWLSPVVQSFLSSLDTGYDPI